MSCEPLTTERLHLRQWRLDDAEAALEIYGDEEITRWIGPMKPLTSLEGARDYLAWAAERVKRYSDGLGVWAMAERDTDRVIGTLLLKPLPDADDVPTEHIETGWHLVRTHWGRGLVTEAAREVLRHGFEDLGLPEIHAVTDLDNTRSMAVCRRIGLQHHGQSEAWYGKRLQWFSVAAPAWRAAR